MILMSDIIKGLHKGEADLLYEVVWDLCRRRFPVIELLQARHRHSEALDIFVHPALLVEAVVYRLRVIDDLEDLSDEECLSTFDEDFDCDPLETLVAQLHRFCLAILRYRLPQRLRELDEAGLWEPSRRHVWEQVSAFVDDTDNMGPDYMRTLLAAMQATRFAKPSDIATWDFTHALIELENRAFAKDGQSFDRKAIAQFLNDDWSLLADEHSAQWSPTDVTRAQERFETFLEQCRRGGEARQMDTHPA